MKKIIIFILMCLVYINLVSGVLTNGIHGYWSFDADCITDDEGNYDFTNNGASNVGGHLNNACDFELAETDYLNADIIANNSLWQNDFTISMWINKESELVGTFFLTQNTALGNYIQLYVNDASPDFVISVIKHGADINSVTASNTEITNGNWFHVVLRIDSDGHINDFRVNNVSQGSDSTPNINPDVDDICTVGGYFSGGYGGFFDGLIDELGIWTRELSNNEVGELYNYGVGFNPLGAPPPANDTTPPVFSNINRVPANLTVLNALENHWIINATITDNIQLNISSPILNVTLENIEVYVAGILLNQQNFIIPYNNSIGSVFVWELDENDYLSGTHNIDHEQFELFNISNATLDSNNKWAKIRFFNVSNDKQLVFSEIMDNNNSGTAEYYYCNENYSSGNPVASDSCTIFYTQTDNDMMHDHRRNTYHRVMPMGINITDGKLNEVLVTSLSYILKRGSSNDEIYFYINNDTNSVETSNNNGNAWTSQTYTINSHIHQIDVNETFIFTICAEDNSSNRNCTGNFSDTIDFPILPPTVVRFLVPELEESYNNTIEIRHTQSFSQTGQTIINYTLYYKRNTTSSWTLLTVNNFPIVTYDWDITTLFNGGYNVRVIVTDSLGLQSITISPQFTIANQESLNTQLLTSINAVLENIYGVISMIGLIFFIVAFMFMAFAFKQPLLAGVSGIGFLFIFFFQISQGVTNNYEIFLTIFSIITSITLIVGSLIFTLMNMGKSVEAENKGLQRIYN